MGALIALAGAVPVFAGGATQIRGEAVLDSAGDCTELPSLFTMKLTGDLVGCWYTPGWEVTQSTPSGVYGERGTETFVGCWGSICGTFSTTYHFTAKFAEDGSEIHGRCQHPITGGTGGFAGITGRVDFKDDVDAGIYYYRGHISLPGGITPTTTLSSTTTSSGGGSTGC